MGLIWTLIIGGVAGFIASKIMKGSGSGIIINVILGIVGGWLGGWLLGLMNLSFTSSGQTWPYLITSLLGAVVLLFIYGLFSKK